MILINLFLLLSAICGCQALGKTCENDDCIAYDSCPNAVDRALNHKNAATEELFRRALCGMKYYRETRIPQVCCSEFGEETFDGNSNDSDGFEDHPNAKLLQNSCGVIDGYRIVGGVIASLYEFPWMALISYHTRYGLQFRCGGSIINSRYILTAAHCVKNKKIAGVRLGEYDVRYQTDCAGEGSQFFCESHIQDVAVEEIIVHENYQGLPLVTNDIALLRLKNPMDFSFKNVAPICLPLSSQLINKKLENAQVTVAGWGLTENDTDSSVLRKVMIPVLTSDSCQNIYNKKLSPGEKDRTENKICAGTLNKDSCSGDSGGPLMLEDKYQGVTSLIQYGVVSAGPRQCGSSAPGIYTEVTKYIDWILNHIKA